MITQHPRFQFCKMIFQKYNSNAYEIENLSRSELLQIFWALRDVIKIVEEAELEPNMNFPQKWGAVLLINGEYYSRTYQESLKAQWVDEGDDGYTDREIGMLIARNNHKFEIKWGGIDRSE